MAVNAEIGVLFTGMIWGHSAKAGQLYATPIETLVDLLGG